MRISAMLDTKFSTLEVSFPESMIAIITLHRPGAANALNTEMGKELQNVIHHFNQNPGNTRVLIITGQGTNAFCAGADLKERAGIDDATWHQQHAIFEDVLQGLIVCPLPVIAAVNGAAYGAGCEIALACDFIYASESVNFALPETSLGIMPGLGGGQLLARRTGLARAKEIIFTAKSFTAEQAHDWGIVNHVSYNDQVTTVALDTAKKIARNAPLAVRAVKQALGEGVHQPLKEALALELGYYNSLIPTLDRQEGVSAFNEKRKANFSGK